MAERNGDAPHITAPVLPVGRPFAPGHDPRRNPGGRPRGLAALARQAVGDGEDLVRFYRAVFAGEAKTVGERCRISLRDRMAAGEWLTARGWGRAPVEVPDDTNVQVDVQQVVETSRSWPDYLLEAAIKYLEEREEGRLAAEREAAEARMRSYLPSPESDVPQGDGEAS